ncbi:digalactosyldiacylglycerol synthase 1 [Pyrus ussuriensis x Pyrus communis]|uniref:Digalactosyldiacylglycerol synthase 1 n=1 Tax=Pyrus ussuriensis x Pyrus communis TaxID=2448454 RepID=A0A5N5GB63_9ROSA|nr:digalactosyldiacylglycerol synthase 1 [Pyrus ussuriensis x Pyrus communis]
MVFQKHKIELNFHKKTKDSTRDCNFLTKAISVDCNAIDRIPADDGRKLNLKRFSSSRSNDVARFLNLFGRCFIDRRSASAECFTSLHPFDMKEKALEEAEA